MAPLLLLGTTSPTAATRAACFWASQGHAPAPCSSSVASTALRLASKSGCCAAVGEEAGDAAGAKAVTVAGLGLGAAAAAVGAAAGAVILAGIAAWVGAAARGANARCTGAFGRGARAGSVK